MRRILPLSLLVAVSAFGQARWATGPRNSVIVEFRDPAALSKAAALPPHSILARFRADLATVSRQAEIRREYTRVFSGVSARVPRGDVAAIAALPYVKRVHDDHEVHALGGPAAAQIGAPTVWTDYGTRGKGVVVAVIDTGVDYTHEALGKGFGAGFKVAGGYDFFNDDADPMDDHGHGTHVSGIIAGDSARITGIAPDATLIAYKVLNANGSGSESDVIAAIERAADPNGDGDTSDHVDVVNLSLGGPGGPDDPVSRAVDNGSKLGIVFCIAAGNAGRSHTVLSPGAARTAITVGAVDGNDVVADFSSRGPSPSNMAMKPEVSAPGVNITSSVPNNDYLSASGTSMATPHVAGAAALLKALHRDWTPAHIKSALMLGAVSLNQEAMSVGAGRIDVAAAAGGTIEADQAWLDFGLDPVQQPAWSASRTVHVTNRGDKSVDWTLGATAPFGVAATLTPQTLTLAPGASAAIELAIDVDNAKASPSFSGGGAITLSGAGTTLRMPWSYVKAVRATLRWDKEQADVLWLDSTRSLFGDAVPVDSNISELLILKPDDYDVIVFGSTLDAKTSELARGTFLYLEKRRLDGDVTINAAEAMGTHAIRGAIAAQDGEPYALIGRLHWPVGTSTRPELLIPALPLHELHTNDLAEGFALYMTEARVDFDGRNIYAVSHPKMNGVKSDVALAATNLTSVPVQLLIPSSPRDDRQIQVQVAPSSYMVGPTASLTALHSTGEPVWNGRLFINPEIEPSYAAGAMFTVIAGDEMRYATPFLRLVNGAVSTNPFGTGRRYDSGPFIFGAGPRLPWVTFFSVSPSQRPGMVLEFYGSHGETLATDRRKTRVVTFNGDGAQLASVNFNPAILNLSAKGRYTIEATDDATQFPDVPQQVKVTLSLDSSLEDYLPPTLTAIYLADGAGQTIRNPRPHSAATLYFSAADYTYTSGNVRVYQPVRADRTALWYRYSGATAWTPLTVTQLEEEPPAGFAYRASLAGVTGVDWARVDLKIDVEDNAGNKTSTVLSPAFSVGSEYPARRRAAP